MGVKISDLTAKGSKIASTDIVEVSVDTGSSFVSRKVTGSELNELSLDTSPQLGGNLDVNGNKITSASNGNISIEPNGTGAVIIGGNSTQATELRFMEDSDNGTNYVALKANNTLAANTTYTLPTADGTSGQVLSTNGTGTLSWATAGGGITVGTTAVTSGTDTRVFFQQGGVIQQDANFTFNNTQKRLTLKAVGTAGTDIPLIIQDSAGTNNLFEFRGNGQLYNINNTSGVSAVSTLTTTDNLSAPALRVISTGGNSSATIAATRLAGSGVSATATNRGFVYLESLGGSHCVIGANDGIAFSAQGISAYNPTSDQMRLKNGNLAIGTGYSASARLDVKAQGALSTDIAFRVRNSADTLNTIQISGDGYLAMGGSPITMGLAPTHTFRGLTSTNNRGLFCVTNSSNTIRLGVGTSGIGLGVAPIDDVALTSDFAVTDAFAFKISGVTKFSHTKYYSNYDLFSFNRTISFASSSTDATVNITATTNKAHLKLDVASAPSGTHLDNGVMWHESNNFGFRVNGATIKIYQETTAVTAATLVSGLGTPLTDTDTFDGYTLKQIVKALRNQGLLA